MIPLPKQSDALHKAWLLRTLVALYDTPPISKHLYFKGGTCAAMQGYISRFSVDLDFDYVGERAEMSTVRKTMERVFVGLGLVVDDASRFVPQYFLKYPHASDSARNTLKIDAAFPPSLSNRYESVLLPEVDRVVTCQTRETMFANKLVTLINRYEKGRAIAGRDVFDIHSFFMNGFSYDNAVILEQRPNETLVTFFAKLEQFVKEHVTQDVVDNDLNTLLPYEDFKQIRLVLKREACMFLRDEIRRLNA